MKYGIALACLLAVALASKDVKRQHNSMVATHHGAGHGHWASKSGGSLNKHHGGSNIARKGRSTEENDDMEVAESRWGGGGGSHGGWTSQTGKTEPSGWYGLGRWRRSTDAADDMEVAESRWGGGGAGWAYGSWSGPSTISSWSNKHNDLLDHHVSYEPSGWYGKGRWRRSADDDMETAESRWGGGSGSHGGWTSQTGKTEPSGWYGLGRWRRSTDAADDMEVAESRWGGGGAGWAYGSWSGPSSISSWNGNHEEGTLGVHHGIYEPSGWYGKGRWRRSASGKVATHHGAGHGHPTKSKSSGSKKMLVRHH